MFSDFSIVSIFTIISAIAAIFVPLIGLIFRRKEHRQLDIVIDKCVFLVNQLAGDLKNFSILIDGEPASEQIAWVTGWIINSGHFDISDRIIEAPLRLKTPEDMQWLRGTIEHCSENVQCSSNIMGADVLQFDWTLLRTGEYIRFEALLNCPLDKIQEDWAIDGLVKTIQPSSRIENVRTDSLVSISQVGERYNPSRPRKQQILPKTIVTFASFLLIFLLAMRIFFPFELDEMYGDGFLLASPVVVKEVNEVPITLEVSVNKRKNIRVTVDQAGSKKHYYYKTPEELLAQKDIFIGNVSARDRSKETFGVIFACLMTTAICWGLLYMWFPGMFMFNSRKRRTAAALFALQRRATKSDSES